MNLALSTLVAVLALLPGMLAWNAYFQGHFTKNLFGHSALAELGHYVVVAIPLNALAVLGFLQFDVGPVVASKLATISLTWDEEARRSFLKLIKVYGWGLTSLYIGLLVLSWGLGSALRDLVWRTRLDLYIQALRPEHPWFYQLTGRLVSSPRHVLPVADILTEMPGKRGTRLYRGIVSEIEVDREGSLRDVVLVMALRGKGRGDDFDWVDVDGDRLILMARHIQSINMHHYRLRPAKGLIRRFVEWLRSVF